MAAPQTSFLVLSHPPDGLAEGEYDRWYDTHVRELLERVPELVGAERFALRFVSSSTGEDVPYRYLTRYEIDGDFDAAMRGLRAAVDSGELAFPDWYPGVGSAGWQCERLEDPA